MKIGEERAMPVCSGGDFREGGLSKRELFAAMAMQGNGSWIPPSDYGPFNWDSREDVCALKARWAVAQADALLAELEKSR